MKQEAGEEKAVLHIESSVRSDTGKYTITAKNEFGEDSGDISVVVVDKPSPPTDLVVTEMFADHCVLMWNAPMDDGGDELTGYVIEWKEDVVDVWQMLPDIVSAKSCTVRPLEKGKKYKFRVSARNIYGVSNPVETDKSVLACGTHVCSSLIEIDAMMKGGVD